MEDAEVKRIERLRTDKLEERSLTSTFVNSAVAGAGATVGVGIVTQGKQAAGKLKDKITKDKN
jgi:hypothetical protein